jgi:RNA polymerase sigma-70 factor (ECF subfamily)
VPHPDDNPDSALAPATLGDVLYGEHDGPLVPEASWAELMQRVAARDPMALCALHERTHEVVYTLIVRMTANPALAQELSLSVFIDIWREAHHYNAERDTVLGWIMKRARATALQRMRSAPTDARPS